MRARVYFTVCWCDAGVSIKERQRLTLAFLCGEKSGYAMLLGYWNAGGLSGTRTSQQENAQGMEHSQRPNTVVSNIT